MKDIALNTAHQLVIMARLSEYCQFQGHTLYHERDPWGYMREKLLQIEEPLASLKGELLTITRRGLLKELRAGPLDEERYSDYRLLFERLLERGDFADLAIHLHTDGAGASQAGWVEKTLRQARPTNLFHEEKKSPGERSPSWEKLVAGLYARLDLERLGRILSRKPRTPKRKAIVLRRVRRTVAEYCAVVRIPTDPSQTFTPFMLPRVEALVAANLRFLNKYR